MKNFALVGAAGYIAPRHMRAIKDTGNRLVAAVDRSDSVGIIDSYFPAADFFTEFERFDRHIEKLRRMESDRRVDFVSIASPNYLHDAHIRFALRVGAHAVCEKPLVLNPWNVDALKSLEAEFGRRAYSILQLRLHPAIRALKSRVDAAGSGRTYDIDLAYVCGRGRWYFYSWKGDEAKSGGIATNIGIHLFDLLIWIFGAVRDSVVHLRAADRSAGFLQLEKARVRWFLSVNGDDAPPSFRRAGERIYRCLTIDGEPIEFSEGFAELHTESYKEILRGNGFGLDESYPAVDAVYRIRNAVADPGRGERHPFLESVPAGRS